MKIIVAPDSFKGSLSAMAVASALADGLLRVWPDASIEKIPLADGGEGTTEAMVQATGGQMATKTVTGPLGDPVEAFFGILGDRETAVVEMAAASGLPLVPEDRRDPRVTTTRGTGELILATIEAGCRRILLGIGGSATNDGGVGMAQALGISFRDEDGKELPPGGGVLKSLHKIDLSARDPRLSDVEIVVACDVRNPLVGPNGASAVYGPQKGATPAIIQELDSGLRRLADTIRVELRQDVADMPGAGAAGGLGAGLVAFTGAVLRPGIEIVLDAVRFRERIAGADLVLTGEGLVDVQTAHGKAPSGVADVASEQGIPVIAVGGGVMISGVAELYKHGFSAVLSTTPRPMPLQEAIANAQENVRHAGETVARLISIGMNG